VANVVMELKNPQLDGDTMTYEARVLQGNMPDNIKASSLFIDIIGMPLTPLYDASPARGTKRRTIIF
jgi:hypothetical protein